jgi:hypothetical protein
VDATLAKSANAMQTTMAVALYAIAKLFANEPKVGKRGENAIDSVHMLSFTLESRCG